MWFTTFHKKSFKKIAYFDEKARKEGAPFQHSTDMKHISFSSGFPGFEKF